MGRDPCLACLEAPLSEPTFTRWWKRRIKQKIMQLRKDISRLERVVTGQLRKAEISEPLERKYNILQKDHQIVLEEIKQRVTTQAAKLRRHKERTTQYRQNGLFECNQKRLFEKLEGIKRTSIVIPDGEERRNFCGGIWEKDVFTMQK